MSDEPSASNEQKDIQLSNQNFKITVDGIIEYVDVRLMMEVSGLFQRRYIDRKLKSKEFSLDFSDVKYRGKLISKFLKICKGESADIKVTDLYFLLLIAEEWESPEISQQLSLFLKSKVDLQELLSKFSTYVHSQQDVSTSFVDVIASKFRYICQGSAQKALSEFINLPPYYICLIIHNPNCEKPPRNLFERLIIDIIKKHGIRCASLIKYIDLFNTDIANIIDLNGVLLEKKLDPMYPNVSKILELRQCKEDYIQLQSQYKDLKEENDNLKKQIQLLKSINNSQNNQ